MANVTPDLRIAIKAAAAAAAKADSTWERRRELNLAAIAALLKKNKKLRDTQKQVDDLSEQIEAIQSRRDKLLSALPYRKYYGEIHAEKFEAAGGVVPPANRKMDSDVIIRDVLECETGTAAQEMLKTRYGIHWDFDKEAREPAKKATRK